MSMSSLPENTRAEKETLLRSTATGRIQWMIGETSGPGWNLPDLFYALVQFYATFGAEPMRSEARRALGEGAVLPVETNPARAVPSYSQLEEALSALLDCAIDPDVAEAGGWEAIDNARALLAQIQEGKTP